jgi:phosphatidylglycerol:prolipoprotein diacylglycerol transferase
VVCGLIGARLFYVVQKWDSYATAQTTAEWLSRLFDMTEGGLVVYGSLFGGLVAWSVYSWLAKLPIWKTADIMAPAMMIGLALGRIGCLMNGCCYGALCEVEGMGLSFPAGSPVYCRQIETGDLLGIVADEMAGEQGGTEWLVREVREESPADRRGIRAGDRILRIAFPQDIWLRAAKDQDLFFAAPERSEVMVQRADAPLVVIPISELPDESRPTWPTQLYSAINAFLLCVLLWFYYPYRKADGELMALLLILYSVARFLEEYVRVDEAGAFGTPLSIGQLVSVVCFFAGIALFVWLRRGGSAGAVRGKIV